MTDLAKLKIAIDTRDFDKAGMEIDKLEKSGKRATGALSKLPAVFTAIAGSMAVREAIRYADTMKLIEGRLSLVTSSSEELTRVQKELFAISQRSRVGFADTADLYARMARSTEALGYTQNELLKVTETISKSFIISGASAESANAAIIQLGQGFASGTLRGEELNSVMEQSPRLAQAIAEGMGVTIGQLRQLGADGKLTAESVMEALRTQGDAISKEFGAMPTTVGQSITQISNSMLSLVGDIDEVTGATSGLSSLMTDFSKSLSSIDKKDITKFFELGEDIVLVGGSLVAANTALNAYGIISKIVASSNLFMAGTYTGVNGAILLTVVRMKALRAAMNTVPILAAAGAIYAISSSLLDAKNNSELLEDTLESNIDKLTKLTKAQLDYRASLLQSAKIEKEIELRKALLDVRRDTFFESEEERVRDKAHLADVRNELKVIEDAYLKIKEARANLISPSGDGNITDKSGSRAITDPSMPNYGMDYSAHVTAYEDYLIQLESKKDRLLATLYPIEGIEQRFMEQQELIVSLREMELISFEEQEALKTEVKRRYDNEQQKLEANKTKALKSMQQSVALEAVALLSTLAGKNKAAAVAGIAIQKGIAIATTIANTQAASMLAFSSQLIPGDPTSIGRAAAAASAVESLGAVKVGLIAATGLLQAGQAMGGGGGGGIGGGGGNVGGYGSNQPMNDNLLAPPTQEEATTAKEVTINLGDTAFVSTEMVRELVNAINDEIGDGVVIRA